MGTRPRRAKSPKDSALRLDTSKDDVAGAANGHAANGHEKRDKAGSGGGKMEYRRKNTPANDAPDAVAAHLMARESFSLDDEVPDTPKANNHGFWDLPVQDQRNFGLLVLLYFLQGIPMGLATGSVPFLLKNHMSYGEIGIFSLASYPYSLKLLWSPIVDAVWSPRLGRRKSWILPIQVLSGLGMLYLGSRVEAMMAATGKPGGPTVWNFTGWWFFLVLMCATQDIAVDGWALTLLHPANLSYASTAQTVGLTAGQFMSYTVFLAFNSQDFANRYFRAEPLDGGLVGLGGYLTFWGWAMIAVTAGLAVLKREDRTRNEDGVWDVYKIMWGVLKLRNVQAIIAVHLIAKIGFQANDGVTNLKLLDKGFGTDNMALTVLIDFPFEIMLGYYVGMWSQRYTPMRIWCWGFIGRLAAAVFAQFTVYVFPAQGVTTWYLLMVISEHVLSTFMNTVMFVAVAAFHAKIADPVIGGTYMTLLATYVFVFFFPFSLLCLPPPQSPTREESCPPPLFANPASSVSNLGGTFPRYFVLRLVDAFTSATCQPGGPEAAKHLAAGTPLVTQPFSCAIQPDKERCLAGGGTCDMTRDGYYIVNVLCVVVGVLTFAAYIRPQVLQLQALPLRAWRLAAPTSK